MHYMLCYDLVDDYLERRAPWREAHLKNVKEAHARGELLLAGALADPSDAAILVFRGSSPAVAERFAQSDPYVLKGVVKSWRVRHWMVVVGDDVHTP